MLVHFESLIITRVWDYCDADVLLLLHLLILLLLTASVMLRRHPNPRLLLIDFSIEVQ
jgi:hypothetical protein